MMCWLFHKWEKWSEIKRASVIEYDTYGSAREFTASYQDRFCARCNSYQYKRVLVPVLPVPV